MLSSPCQVAKSTEADNRSLTYLRPLLPMPVERWKTSKPPPSLVLVLFLLFVLTLPPPALPCLLLPGSNLGAGSLVWHTAVCLDLISCVSCSCTQWYLALAVAMCGIAHFGFSCGAISPHKQGNGCHHRMDCCQCTRKLEAPYTADVTFLKEMVI